MDQFGHWRENVCPYQDWNSNPLTIQPVASRSTSVVWMSNYRNVPFEWLSLIHNILRELKIAIERSSTALPAETFVWVCCCVVAHCNNSKILFIWTHAIMHWVTALLLWTSDFLECLKHNFSLLTHWLTLLEQFHIMLGLSEDWLMKQFHLFSYNIIVGFPKRCSNECPVLDLS
jgi:hypothetical protein